MADAETMAKHIDDATNLLKELANANRLMIFCSLGDGELSVSELNERIPLSQSALSQHLARMRASGFLATRKEGQTVYYRIVDGNVGKLINTLQSIYCPEA